MATSESVVLVAASGSRPLAGRCAEALGLPLTAVRSEIFPDGERQVRVPVAVRGHDVVVLASTAAPVGETLLELRLLADACHHAGASRLFGVIPYFGYARQDRRETAGEALGMKVTAEIIGGAGFARLIVLDLHAPATEGCFPCPVEHLSAVELLAEAVRPHVRGPAVIVAPDAGAAKRAGQFGGLLGLPVAMAQKTRASGHDVATGEILGDVEGRVPIIVDDMVSTGATIAGALAALTRRGCADGALVVATHGLFVGGAVARLAAAGATRVWVTDSVSHAAPEPAIPIERVGLAPLVAAGLRRILPGRPAKEGT